MKVKALLYCTKAKPLMEKSDDTCYEIGMSSRYIIGNDRLEIVKPLNGKIVCECEVETEEILKDNYYDENLSYNKGKDFFALKGYQEFNEGQAMLEKRSCCDEDMLNAYKPNYALHLSNIKVFDKPKELSDYYKIDNVGGMLFTHTLKIAPQNMQRVSVNRWVYAEYNPSDIRVLISIQPQWVCKILNGEKDIEVRRKVLKGMVE